jgi:hypothetical protein
MRTIAIGVIDEFEPEAHHKAACAIWIRMGDRQRAVKSYEQADKLLRRNEFPGGTSLHRIQLNELKSVIDSGDIASLNAVAVDPNLFADFSRPFFARYSSLSPIESVLARIFANTLGLGLILTSLFFLQSDAQTTFFAMNSHYSFPSLVALYVLIFVILRPVLAVQRNNIMEFSRIGILRRAFRITYSTDWDHVKFGEKGGTKFIRLPLSQKVTRAKGYKTTKLELKSFRDCWPPISLEEAIRECAPHFRRSEDYDPFAPKLPQNQATGSVGPNAS